MPDNGRKALLRKKIAASWPRSISDLDLAERSLRAQARLLAVYSPSAGMAVALYAGMPGEVGTRVIAESVRAEGGLVYYPRILPDGEMSFFLVEGEGTLVRDRFGIPAPDGKPERRCKDEGFDLVVVPGLAFDARGNRLGRGAGYYDRFLARPVSKEVVGLAFSWQIVSEVPHDPWDVPMDGVVTEEGVIRTSYPANSPRTCK